MSSRHPTETPKKVYKASQYVDVSCCRLCKSVGGTSHWQNLYGKGNQRLLAVAKELYGNALPQSEFLPHLLCRPCERRLNNFRVFKSMLSESQRSFELNCKGQAVHCPLCCTHAKVSRPGKNQTWPEMCLETIVTTE